VVRRRRCHTAAVYELLLFDLDGTLVDSCGDIADALNAALAAHGLPTHEEDVVATMVGEGATELVRKAAPHADDAAVESIRLEFRRRYHERPVDRSRLYPGVAATLAAIAEVPKAVATNKPGALAREIVSALGLAPFFFAVLGEDDVGQCKPSPAVVDRLRERVGAARERTLFIGDSIIDARTAAAAGVDLCLVEWGYEREAVRRDIAARHRIARFADLLEILR